VYNSFRAESFPARQPSISSISFSNVSARFTDASLRRLLVRRSTRQNAATESLKRS
jgi:hypothetical protein